MSKIVNLLGSVTFTKGRNANFLGARVNFRIFVGLALLLRSRSEM